MGTGPQNTNFINQVAKTASKGFDNGPRAAEAFISEYHIEGAYNLGKTGLPLDEAINNYGDFKAIRDAHARGVAFANKSAEERSNLQKEYAK